jgi:hypothetical protein
VTPSLLAGLGLALASAIALNAGFLLQQRGASRAPGLSLRRPLASARALLAARGWLLGFVIGIGGWVFYLAALTRAPLSLVQAVAAGGVGLLVLADAALHRVRPSRRDLGGALVAMLGLAALGLSLQGAGKAVSPPSAAGIVTLVALVAGAVAWTITRGTAGAGGAGAGLLYGLGDVATKALLVTLPVGFGAGALVASPYLYLAAACHGGGFLALQRAFQRGGAVATVAPMTAALNILPIVAGVAVLGDPLPGSPALVALRLAGLVAAVAGSVVLAGPREAHSTSPRRIASATAAARSETPSLS